MLLAGLAIFSLTPLMLVQPAAAEPADDAPVTVGRVATVESLLIRGEATAPTISDAELQDLQTLARSKGESVASLAHRFRDRESFDALTTALAKSPTYVQAGYSTASDENAEVWIRFTTKPNDSTLAEIASKVSYRVRIEYGSRLNWGTLNDTMERLFILTNSQPGVTEASAEISSETESITVSYTGQDQQAPETSTVAENVMKAASSDPEAARYLGSIQVTFRRSDDLAKSATEATVRGGYSLSTDTVPADCTSGIPITKGGQKGITTAMHCANGLRYGGVNNTGIIQYGNAASTTSSGAHIDLQWHSTMSGSSTSASFYTAPSTIRSINAANNAVVGDYVCHYGMGTGYGCEYVYQLAICYTPGDLQFCGLAALRSWITDGGDSGGPWFNNETVKGVHSGRAVLGGVVRSVYTPQTRIAENLDASVLQS